MMTKTDYENVARILRGVPEPYKRDVVVSACQVFAGRDEKFNRKRFQQEAGYMPCKESLCRQFFTNPNAMQTHYVEFHRKKVDSARS